jgi:argininosuccinate lyase
MDEGFPAPVYAETILAPNFAHAQRHFLDALLQIQHAHTRMLASAGILTREEAGKLIAALHGLDRGRIEAAAYDGRHEDLFFFVEGLMEKAAGPGTAGRMHIARSRNDIAVTMYRMAARRETLGLVEHVARLRGVLLDLAGRHRTTLMPAHTHMQPAQPTTLAHYLLAAIEFLARDAARLQAAYARVNLSPMGAAAITTSGFPIDRELTARLLGFEGLAENSYGAIASIDYITEAAAAVAVAMISLGKLTQDLLLWSSREFGFLRLPRGYVQISSIMPQKRNPVALEHVRILASRALGEAQAVLTCAHNTPFGDINDSEDDLQPLVSGMFSGASRALLLLAGVLGSVEVDCQTMSARAHGDFLTATELADTLVRTEGLGFREAHQLVSDAVKDSRGDDTESVYRALAARHPGLRMSREEVEQALDPMNFVNVRKARGGPAPDRTAEAVEAARETQRAIEEWVAEKTAHLERSRSALFGPYR